MKLARLALLGAFAAACWSGTAASETLLERGTYLMRGIVACGNCHTPKFGPLKDVEFAGGFPIKEEGIDAYAPNITPDRETGIGNWTDAQLVRAIREGKRPDGSTIGPPMPIVMYRGLSDRDVNALVAYMRQVKPVRNAVKKSTYKFPLPPAYGPPVGSVPEVSRADKIAYGRYLAGPAGHCMDCHTPMVKGRRDFDNRLGAGGFPFHGPWGTVAAADITPTGNVGGWSDQQVIDSITRGVRPDGTKLVGPMPFPYYNRMSRHDLEAIVAYLRTLKPMNP